MTNNNEAFLMHKKRHQFIPLCMLLFMCPRLCVLLAGAGGRKEGRQDQIVIKVYLGIYGHPKERVEAKERHCCLFGFCGAV